MELLDDSRAHTELHDTHYYDLTFAMYVQRAVDADIHKRIADLEEQRAAIVRKNERLLRMAAKSEAEASANEQVLYYYTCDYIIRSIYSPNKFPIIPCIGTTPTS